jgi:hypothetical protein
LLVLRNLTKQCLRKQVGNNHCTIIAPNFNSLLRYSIVLSVESSQLTNIKV